jgi:Uma2 family endonuclease
MATAVAPVPVFISLDEYLRTVYHPDCDFVDGHLEERNVGDTLHSLLQAELAVWFGSRRRDWNIRVMTELRTRVSDDRVRLPDVTVAYDDVAMKDKIREKPALIAIEVLSPDDRLPRVLTRLADYSKMGVRNIWVLDPIDRVALTYRDSGLMAVEADRLTVADSPIYLDLKAVFSALD